MITIHELSKETGRGVEELIKLVEAKLPRDQYYGVGDGVYFGEAGAELVRMAVAVPPAVPTRLQATVIGPCANEKWVWCRIEGMEGRHAVLIPRRLRGKLHGKPITIEAITDIAGTTYRHESIGR